MQVSAISAQSFFGKRDNIDRAVSVSNDDIRAYAASNAIYRGKKRAKNINRLFLSVPLLAAAAAGILTKGNTTFLSKEVTGSAAKVANAVKAGAWWSMLFGVAGAQSVINNGIEKHSQSYRKFNQNHPMLSVIGNLGVFLAATATIPMAARAGYAKLGKNLIGHINRGIGNMTSHLNNIKLPVKLSDKLTAISDHTPELVKDGAKGLLRYSPYIALFSAFIGGINNNNRTRREYYATYETISDRQRRLAQARIAELKAAQAKAI